MIDFARRVFSRILFFFKHRAGFRDLGYRVNVTGTVAFVYGASEDGDACFDLIPDEEWAYLRRSPRDGRETWNERQGALHCECMPGGPRVSLAVGQRVRLDGWWAFDGCHHDGTGVSVGNVLAAILGADPNWAEGWCEIHPVTACEVIG